MADAASIGAGASRYTGDAGLGGGSFGAFKLDVNPIMDLAKYTMLYNKAEYDQRQKDADEKIVELSKIAQLNLNDLRGKDRDELLKDYNDLIVYAREYASKPAKTQQEKIARTLEYQLKFNAVKDKYTSGKARAIKYIKELDDIDSTVDNAAKKDVYKKQLEETFNKTPITELFGSVNKYTTSSVGLPDAETTEVNRIDILGNEDINTKGTIYLPSINSKIANYTGTGLANLYKTDLSGMTPGQIEEANVQGAVHSEAKVWADMADNFNRELAKPEYYTTDEQGNKKFDEDKFKKANASNDILMRPFKALKDLNDYSTKGKASSMGGIFEDHGVKYKLPTNVTPEDFDAGIVDFNAGKVSQNQLIQAGMFAKYKGDKFTKTIQETDDQIQIDDRKAANYRARLNENGANYRANLPYEKAKMGASENAAKDFGNIIYGVNGKIGWGSNGAKIINGAIVNKDGAVDITVNTSKSIPAEYFDNTIITEFNKYAGAERVLADGTVVKAISPSRLKKDDNGNFTVRFKDGIIDGVLTDDGSYAGVDQFQYITTMTSQKGVTKYKKPEDISGGGTPPKIETDAEYYKRTGKFRKK